MERVNHRVGMLERKTLHRHSVTGPVRASFSPGRADALVAQRPRTSKVAVVTLLSATPCCIRRSRAREKRPLLPCS
jgi:hypothetical protein